MKPLRDWIDEYLNESPFLEDGLNEGIINLSAIARIWQPRLESDTGEEVSIASIIMALRRRDRKISVSAEAKMSQLSKNFGDLIVRSGLTDITFQNSPTLGKCQSDFLKETSNMPSNFYAFSKGVNETTMVFSTELLPRINEIFTNENQISIEEGLASITIMLPEKALNTVGIFYFIFKNLTQRSINVVEVISTTNEFTIIVSKRDIEKAFEVINGLKN